ncbi:MAG: cell division protein ZapA [Acidobacteria bacterium]|nr:cell division protein ZapA [Acidobacteriota bacterium]
MSDMHGSRIGQPVIVEIGGKRFRLRGSSEETLRALAARVDDAVRDVAGDETPLDDPKVALLAALNIASEAEEKRALAVARIASLERATVAAADRIASLRAALEAEAPESSDV